LRDYFRTEIAAKSDDPNVAMRLIRHTRTVETRMRQAVEFLGGDSGGDSKSASGLETSQLAKLENLEELAKMLGFLKGKVGGGGQIRTVDAADMSRVL
jgi:hypothetical protein